jgi:hypothetical protein
MANNRTTLVEECFLFNALRSGSALCGAGKEIQGICGIFDDLELVVSRAGVTHRRGQGIAALNRRQRCNATNGWGLGESDVAM